MTLKNVPQHIKFKCSFPHYSGAGQKFLICFIYSEKVTAVQITEVCSNNKFLFILPEIRDTI